MYGIFRALSMIAESLIFSVFLIIITKLVLFCVKHILTCVVVQHVNNKKLKKTENLFYPILINNIISIK